MTASPLESLASILSVPITKDDLSDIDECDYDEKFITAFDNAWSNFLQDYPIPKGEREEQIIQLQIKAKEIEASKENVERELKKQATFFRNSREELERTYAIKLQNAMDQQRSVNEELSKIVESVTIADQIQSQTLPWLHFIEELDTLVATTTLDSQSTTTSNERSVKTAKPSSRAMYLTEIASKNNNNHQQDLVNSSRTLTAEQQQTQQLLTSYRIDHTILRTNVNMLQNEIERYEKLLECQPFVAQLLSDIDAWGIFRSTDTTSSIADTTVSNVTIPIQISDMNDNQKYL